MKSRHSKPIQTSNLYKIFIWRTGLTKKVNLSAVSKGDLEGEFPLIIWTFVALLEEINA